MVGYDDDFEVEVFFDEIEVAYDARKEFELVESVDLVGDRRLNDERAVAVDEECAFHVLRFV